ncbi:AI-2E family transporter [Devosia rhizoryzae]|uniref:AI-2E family transporter n=1 Tax=Devosia rhizoryzae TaxID=2774137 RepID=A0ABX7CBL4_9HYPH|nr:AI-2E family transporter [Devosia rhizoryzae]QQR40152.1 AI-2E family transporter [Devosia rhizoryzae]
MSELPTSPQLTRRRVSAFESIAVFAITAALLYFGAGIFVPLVLAILLAFALNPLVSWLSNRLHLPDPAAVILAVLLALAVLAAFALLAGTQIAHLASALPGYQQTIQSKVAGLQAQFGNVAWLDQLTNMMSSLGQNAAEDPAAAQDIGDIRPIPVTISNELGPFNLLTSVMGSIVGPVATIAIVTVFLIFLLMGRADLQDRFIRLVSAGRYSLTNLAITDASRRVGRYLIIQLMVNTTYGIIFGTGLWLIGVPSAPLWGLLIVLFRYIPFVGALIVAVLPFSLAFAVDPGWNMLLLSVGLFLVIDLTTANIIEPRLYGKNTGVSPLAILLSAMFWATLWGPVGLILATPMTVCLVVIGRHLPQFQFLETLLGSEPVLSPAERLYQRMLKGNTEDAIEHSETFLEEHGKGTLVTDVLLRTLRLGTSELSDRPESLAQRRQLISTFDRVLETVLEPSYKDHAPVLLIGGRTEIDEGAARLIGVQLADEELQANVLPPGAIRQESIGRLDLTGVTTLALVFMGTDIRAQCRYVARRIRRMAPELQIVAVVLNPLAADETTETLHVDSVFHQFDAAVDGIVALEAPKFRHGTQMQRQPFAGLGRGDDELGQELDAIAKRFGVPAVLINLLNDERHSQDEDALRLTQLVVEGNEPLVVHSTETNDKVGENAYMLTNGIDLYAGVPLVLADGTKAGALALIDYDPHPFTAEDTARLQAEADALVKRFG